MKLLDVKEEEEEEEEGKGKEGGNDGYNELHRALFLSCQCDSEPRRSSEFRSH